MYFLLCVSTSIESPSAFGFGCPTSVILAPLAANLIAVSLPIPDDEPEKEEFRDKERETNQ